MRFAIVGAAGQLGRALGARLGGDVCWSGDRSELDIRDGDAVRRMVESARPEVILNASAYNAVDAAETAPAEALAVNALGPRHLAWAARQAGALLVHVSTDYVFDGAVTRPYVEDDRAQPLSAYGASKLAGEILVTAAGGECLIVRTSAVLGVGGSQAKGGSFVERILARARSGGPLRVVADQIFSPTYAPDLAAALLALVGKGARGLYHVTNDGICSWHELAEASVRAAGLDLPVEKIRAQDLQQPARRPAYSVLSNVKYRALGLAPLRHWRDMLPELLANAR
jgi:dTDP-4-dehydrorhamnose reductase